MATTEACVRTLAIGVTLLVAACGGAQGPVSRESPTAHARGETVTVNAAEYSLSPSKDRLTPGTYTFVLKNSGDMVHALSIKGPGVDTKTSKAIRGGERTELTVRLQKGRYDLWCPVDGHRGLGMKSTLTVG